VAPVLDKNNMNSYDLYVHFVGPNLLVGFSPDITRWNTVINFSGREFYCPPETDVFISLSNTNLKFRYSAIIFNNFNNNQPVNRKKTKLVNLMFMTAVFIILNLFKNLLNFFLAIIINKLRIFIKYSFFKILGTLNLLILY
jgi:hypothetical protein